MAAGTPAHVHKRRAFVAVGALYLLGAGLTLFWPSTVTRPFQDLLSLAASVVPYGDRLLEFGANVLLFVPAGWLAGTLLPRGRRWLAIVGGVVASTLIELAQGMLLPERVASARDILANGLGVALGVLIAAFIGRHEQPDEAAAKRSWSRRSKVAAWAGTSLLAVTLVLGAWLMLDALRARDALAEVASLAPRVITQIREDPKDAYALLWEIEDAAARAHTTTVGPHWTIAGGLPWVGDNTRAIQTVTASVDMLASQGLRGLVTAAVSVTPELLAPKNGRIDTQPLVEVRDEVAASRTAVEEAHAMVAEINRGNLLGPVASAIERLQGELADARNVTSATSAAVEVLPSMLGASGSREWLMLAQNNAETRATGGIPGAALLIRADDGTVDIVEQRSATAFRPLQDPVLPLTDAEQRLFGPQLGLFLQDVNLTPDFPRSAELAAGLWRGETGQEPEYVLSLDPVALGRLLTATGPVNFLNPSGDTITLSADGAASFLMSEVYTQYPGQDDAVFALAARAILARLLSSETDPSALITALSDSIAEGRLLVWSADTTEQTLLEQVGASGSLLGESSTAQGLAPALGVFLNLTTSSKTGYYLDSTASVIEDTLMPDGERQLTLMARLTSRLEPGEIDQLPSHVRWGNPDGTLRVNVLVYAPTDGSVTQLSTEWRGFVTEHNGLQVSAQTVKVAPSQTVELSWHVTTGPDQPGDPVIRLTPGARNP